jgi:hypothetical protein
VATAADEPPPAYAKLGFDVLASFPVAPPPPHAAPNVLESQIPARIKAWDGRKVVVTGFMLPVTTRQGRVTELLLTVNTQAAGNLNPFAVNEWVVVRIPGGVLPQTLRPVSFFGTLRVRAVYEQGFLTGIYELAADRMSDRPVP